MGNWVLHFPLGSLLKVLVQRKTGIGLSDLSILNNNYLSAHHFSLILELYIFFRISDKYDFSLWEKSNPKAALNFDEPCMSFCTFFKSEPEIRWFFVLLNPHDLQDMSFAKLNTCTIGTFLWGRFEIKTPN